VTDHEPRQPFIRTSQWDPERRSRNYCSEPGCRRPISYVDRRWVHDAAAQPLSERVADVAAELTAVLPPGLTFEFAEEESDDART
jgi:hypothetical protein